MAKRVMDRKVGSLKCMAEVGHGTWDMDRVDDMARRATDRPVGLAKCMTRGAVDRAVCMAWGGAGSGGGWRTVRSMWREGLFTGRPT